MKETCSYLMPTLMHLFQSVHTNKKSIPPDLREPKFLAQ